MRYRFLVPILVFLLFAGGCGGSSAGPAASPPPTSSASSSTSSDPLSGSWTTGMLTRAQVLAAFQAAGGTRAAATSFFAGVAGKATQWIIIEMDFNAGSFTEHESSDSGDRQEAYLASYTLPTDGELVLTSANPGDTCVGTYSYSVQGHTLRLHAKQQCPESDGIPNTTIFASYPYHQQ